jgi:hypothetical protein
MRTRGCTPEILGALLLAMLAGVGAEAQSVVPRDTFTVRIRANAGAYEAVLPVPLERAWTAIPDAFHDLGYAGGRSLTRGERRTYMTPELTISGSLYPGERTSDYLDCGRTSAGTHAADDYSLEFAVVMRAVAQSNAETMLEIVVDGRARDRGRSTNSVNCTGTGRLERMFAEAVARRLGLIR